MHFSIPGTAELNEPNGSSYTVFNLHVNGVYHCSVRYRQLYDFQLQLKKEFPSVALPPFPPKKLFPLSAAQLDERRVELERFIQQVSQIPQVSNCSTFNGFLLNAQQESLHEAPEDVDLDIFLANGHKVSVRIKSTNQTEDVLEAMASKIELPDQFVYYFGLFLVSKESNSDYSIVRKLQEFESPYISLKSANVVGSHWIMLRKAFWDPTIDDELMEDRIAMNLLYIQAISDIDRDWVTASDEQLSRLSTLQQRGSKKEYLRFARSLKYYGYVVFKPCTTDYPQPSTKVLVAAGNRELNFRIQCRAELKEVSFKVTRMRCWRISSMVSDNDVGEGPVTSGLELSFEYLVAKNTMKWITLYSSQAILMSMSLQGMVDELIMKKEGHKMKRPQDRNRSSRNSIASDNLVKSPTSPTANNGFSASSPSAQPASPTSTSASSSLMSRQPSEKSASSSVRTAPYRSPFGTVGRITENDAFDGIRDDDL
jgi:sorting nexin-17